VVTLALSGTDGKSGLRGRIPGRRGMDLERITIIKQGMELSMSQLEHGLFTLGPMTEGALRKAFMSKPIALGIMG
jgi:hypothetical protein